MIPLDASVYEVLALGMRYVFTCIGVMIVLRTFSWLRKDRRLKHKRIRQLPDAGTVGILTVITGGRQLREGAVIPVPHEGVIGCLRTCDMVTPVPEVADIHADFVFTDGKGLFILPRRGCSVIVDGQLIRTPAEGKRCPMQHGSILEIGQAVLQLGVFAGLTVKETRIEPWYDEPEPSPLPFWQHQRNDPYPPQPEQPWPVYPPTMQPPSQGVPPIAQTPQQPNRPFWWQGGDADEP